MAETNKTFQADRYDAKAESIRLEAFAATGLCFDCGEPLHDGECVLDDEDDEEY